jgi:hypothetical protein
MSDDGYSIEWFNYLYFLTTSTCRTFKSFMMGSKPALKSTIWPCGRRQKFAKPVGVPVLGSLMSA